MSGPLTVAEASERRWLRTAVLGALFTSMAAALVLLWTGVIGEVTFWRVAWASLFFNLVVVLRQNAELLRGAAMDHAIIVKATEALHAIHIAPAVQCSGCHTTAHLTSAPEAVTPDGDLGFPLPPGWEMVNGRPYCDECRARARARAN